MTVPVGPRVARDVHSAILAEIAPNAARLKAASSSHLGRALLVAVNLHLLAVGAYWALSVATFSAPVAPAPEGDVWRPVEVLPPAQPKIDPAPTPPGGGTPTRAAATGAVTPVPDTQADPDATIATDEQIAVSTRGPVTGVANDGDGNSDNPGTSVPTRPNPPEINRTVPPVPQPQPVDEEEETPSTEIVTFSEVAPEIIGGLAGVQARVTYPRFEREAGIQGTVVVRFVVEPSGEPSAVEVARSVSSGLDAAAVAAVRQTRFTPGVQNGQPVRVRMTLPVRFTLR